MRIETFRKSQYEINLIELKTIFQFSTFYNVILCLFTFLVLNYNLYLRNILCPCFFGSFDSAMLIVLMAFMRCMFAHSWFLLRYIFECWKTWIWTARLFFFETTKNMLRGRKAIHFSFIAQCIFPCIFSFFDIFVHVIFTFSTCFILMCAILLSYISSLRNEVKRICSCGKRR